MPPIAPDSSRPSALRNEECDHQPNRKNRRTAYNLKGLARVRRSNALV
jgi:hypothetical protein